MNNPAPHILVFLVWYAFCANLLPGEFVYAAYEACVASENQALP